MMSPTHPKTRSYFQRGLFDGLTSFRELEGRISGLATKGGRGDAFEVFAEAYLATVAIEKAKHLWPGASVPHSLRKRLALTIGDKGVDGVFETQLGEYHAYQVKFRTSRPSLTWDELSTFIGLADRVERRVLFTNCDRFADVVKQRTGFYAITGNDLDKLELQDFAVIRAWLEGARIERQPKNPLPHQAQAIDNLLSALRDQNRATALMACGTGKTLVALWVAERIGVQNILVLVPSLALLRQTLHEWVRETSWQSFAHLCVCSDPTVKPDSDELVVRPTDLDFPVSTDSAQVRKFLAAKFDGVKLVFSTYQSAHVVAAGMKRGHSFDLAVFDEAHKTAGREGVHFGFALNDRRLPIRKRLFLTATPRHYDVRKRDKKGDAIKARHVANQLALQAAVAQHGVSKIFTFHGSVASAAAFTRDGSEGIGNHLSGFDAYHVNGSMPASERENIMTEFYAASKAVISNAKCLTEGVDVPAVDMVAFLTPKRSRVDIVQATGRAMRKADGKTTGYVLVPLFVEQAKGETIEEALARTEFDEVWNVLQAMQEQDDMLAEIIRQIREDRGRAKGFDDARFREKVEFLGPQISLEALRDAITTTCVEALGENWDEHFGQLKAFKEKHGHCNIPVRWVEDRKLGLWVHRQRQFWNQKLLLPDRKQKLEEIGFVADPFEQTWQVRFKELVAYKERHGHCNVPDEWEENPQLAKWVSYQRRSQNIGKLNKERFRLLDKLGFVWDTLESTWHSRFDELQDFKHENGHCNVPARWRGNSLLSTWVQHQRRNWNAGQLNEERIEKLRSLGFVVDPFEEQWNVMFEELRRFHLAHGHCIVPRDRPVYRDLVAWIYKQRRQRKRSKLPPERFQKLNALGFSWDASDDSWAQMYSDLHQFRIEHGHCEVPRQWSRNPGLYLWVKRQRQRRSQGKLSSDRIAALDRLGFIWDRFDAPWDEMFQSIKEFKKRYEHCHVPARWAGHPRLARWVSVQRCMNKHGKLASDRFARLDQIGFQWEINRQR